jgi:hypothetical protein
MAVTTAYGRIGSAEVSCSVVVGQLLAGKCARAAFGRLTPPGQYGLIDDFADAQALALCDEFRQVVRFMRCVAPNEAGASPAGEKSSFGLGSKPFHDRAPIVFTIDHEDPAELARDEVAADHLSAYLCRREPEERAELGNGQVFWQLLEAFDEDRLLYPP